MNVTRQHKPMAGGMGVLLCCLLLQSSAATADISYRRDIQPLFDRYCVACHACLDAPCQLDLSEAAGVLRGASKSPVYDGSRIDTTQPSRLGIDAGDVSAWRARDFFTVLGEGDTTPVLLRLLELAARNPLAPRQPVPESLETGINRRHACPAPDEIDAVTKEMPHLGMPFALPAIPAQAHDLLSQWIAAGAPVESQTVALPAVVQREIKHWETWLNDSKPYRRLLSRWLYEHWALARLHFTDHADTVFLRLVRSSTPPGKPVKEIATRFPNSDPGGPFYYRFRAVTGTRVYKTHIRFPLSRALLQRIEQLFLAEDRAIKTLPGYGAAERANPFTTFAALPAVARYRFMLEHAEYFVRTFIRGPVCRGQLATDVIRDHFWVMFQAPEHDPFVTDADYRRRANPMLALPGIDNDLLDGAESWLASAGLRKDYAAMRQARLAKRQPKGPGLDSIWQGDTNAMLTVFRHHDSATVKRGWVGQLPLTTWWMDFPLLERSYYNLVVNFDVFGNVSHQAQTRLYFDLIRNESEQNFLRMLPASARQQVIDSWYQGSGQLKLWLAYHQVDTQQPSAIRFSTQNPYRELLQGLLSQLADINVVTDTINRAGRASSETTHALLSRLAGPVAADMPAIRHLPNASLLYISDEAGVLYSMLRNRRHSNVAFILGESLRYQEELDSLSVVPGIATGYPNFIFSLRRAELPAFVAHLRAPAQGERSAFIETVVERWGLRRSDPAFWSVFHDIHARQRALEPLEAGILDLNRYVDYPAAVTGDVVDNLLEVIDD